MKVGKVEKSNRTIAYVRCACKNEGQDKLYGNGVRVANRTQKGDGVSSVARCSVCSASHNVNNNHFR